MLEVTGIFLTILYKVKKACGPNLSFYKYLSVPFLYNTGKSHSCVQGQENSTMISLEILKQSFVPSPNSHFIQFNSTDDTEQGIQKNSVTFT